jgi:ABC-type transporter Mla subunit MlaD
MRRIALITALLAAGAAGAATVAGADDTHTYKLEMYDAFGLVQDAEVKVAGVTAGKITGLDINEEKRALVTVELSGPLSVLGDQTECKSEPQSLIAEYFLDCQPAGDPLPDGATVPKLVTQTVQNDLVLNTLRLPYRQRLSLLINEFGTALAGNPENLNEAIRMGAPALQDLHKALKLLADQNRTIAQLNVDSDEIVGKLAERSDDVVRFIHEAGDTAVASAERRDDLSTDFDLLDDVLRELNPTMAELENVAVETTPLLADLRLAAPGLNTLATNLPAFARATERSLVTLGKAAVPGKKALRRGQDEIQALADAAVPAKPVAKQARLFLDDIADPRRAVQIDARAGEDTGRTSEEPGQRDTMGYTGMEGLLNFFYILSLATNQYDIAGHTTHISLREVEGPCGSFNAGEDWPAIGGGRTTDPVQADPCVGLLGENQPGITPGLTFEELRAQGILGRYPGSVCPNGSNDLQLCNPGIAQPEIPDSGLARTPARSGARTEANADAPAESGGSPGAGLPADPEKIKEDLEEILNLPGKALDDLGLGGKKGGNNGGKGGKSGLGDAVNGLSQGTNQATQDLLDFLLGP